MRSGQVNKLRCRGHTLEFRHWIDKLELLRDLDLVDFYDLLSSEGLKES